MPKAEPYILSVGTAGADRLKLLDEIYGPYTHAFFHRLGLREGMQVLDIGCGPGNVSCWIAKQIGENGRVVGVDISSEQTQLAQQNARAQQLKNVEFIVSGIDDLHQMNTQFDIVFSRFLLVHLKDPKTALQAMYDLVKPSGYLACDEPSMHAVICVPVSDAFQLSKQLTYQVVGQKGVDFDLGQKLYSLFRYLSFTKIEGEVIQPFLASAHRKMMWPLFFLEAKEEYLASGLITSSTFEDMISGLMKIVEDEDSFILPMSNFQVCGRKKG